MKRISGGKINGASRWASFCHRNALTERPTYYEVVRSKNTDVWITSSSASYLSQNYEQQIGNIYSVQLNSIRFNSLF